MRKYLDDIDVKDRPDLWCKDDKRQMKWHEQQEKYGFDSREIWSLDYTFYLWLYERLMMYKEIAGQIVNLDESHITYEDKEYTELELITELLKRLQYRLKPPKCDWEFPDQEHYKYVHDIPYIFAVLLPTLWY